MHPIESGGYQIQFNENGYNALNNYLNNHRHSSIFVIVDANTNEHCLPVLLSMIATETIVEIIEIEPGEELKTIETCVELWNILTELGSDRKSLILNVGGGVITDLGGFVASTFKRGIDFINVPTTLLGMVDASVGGKNGVDLGSLKNQVGTITVPKLVVVDTSFLSTLPQNEMRSGLAEMLKHGLIADRKYWEKFLNLSEIDFGDFDGLIYESVLIKNTIVMQDLSENGIRKALNFGHTLGHAIESYFLINDNLPTLLHGEAIAAGMILESYLSMEKGLLTREDFYQVKYIIKSIYEEVVFTEIDVASILGLLIHDKKNEYGNISFTLLNGLGSVVIDQTAENELIISAFEEYRL